MEKSQSLSRVRFDPSISQIRIKISALHRSPRAVNCIKDIERLVELQM
jgi:hypothetical protein